MRIPTFIFTVLILLLASMQLVEAQPQVHMKALAFQDERGPYLEIQFYLPGNSLSRNKVDSTNAYSSIHNTVVVKHEGTIVNFEKYTLTGPEGTGAVDLHDIVRFRVPQGDLIIESKAKDVFGSNQRTISRDTVHATFSENRMSCSDIALYSSIGTADEDDPEKFRRGAYFVEPLSHDFYHRDLDELISYIEVYHSDLTFSRDYALSYALMKREDGGKVKEVKRKYKRMSPSNTEGVFLRMDLSDVPSGMYTYRIEIMDRKKQVKAEKAVRFFRSKPSLDVTEEVRKAAYEESFVQDMNAEELKYSLKAIAPKVDQRDVERFNNLIAKGSAESKRSFLYNFWYQVDPLTTHATYRAYMEVARALDNMYDTGFGHGFETDRGWIYLKYGRPDDLITVEDDPSAPPYEIWTYYQLPSTSQKNVKFVFYNPHLTTNGFELLHSTARGEINNPQWLLELYEDAPEEIQGDNHINADRMQDNWNRHALEYFNDN